MDTEHVKYEILLQAQSPVAHMSDTIGNTQILATSRIVDSAGHVVQLPIISGNSIRHHLRSALADMMLAAAGLDGECLSLNALRLLYKGGQLTKDAGKRVPIKEYRELCQVVPALALFGGAVGSRLESGRIQVRDAKLVCQESMHLLPDWVRSTMLEHGVTTLSLRSQIEEVQRVGMDPALRVETRRRLAPSEQEQCDAIVSGDDKSLMMPYTYQTVIQGSMWFWTISADCWTPLERDAFHCAVMRWLSHGTVGGKSGSGAGGHLLAIAARHVALPDMTPRRAHTDLSTQRAGDIFRASMEANRERLASFLGAL